jgi:hypothetical protein
MANCRKLYTFPIFFVYHWYFSYTCYWSEYTLCSQTILSVFLYFQWNSVTSKLTQEESQQNYRYFMDFQHTSNSCFQLKKKRNLLNTVRFLIKWLWNSSYDSPKTCTSHCLSAERNRIAMCHLSHCEKYYNHNVWCYIMDSFETRILRKRLRDKYEIGRKVFIKFIFSRYFHKYGHCFFSVKNMALQVTQVKCILRDIFSEIFSWFR